MGRFEATRRDAALGAAARTVVASITVLVGASMLATSCSGLPACATEENPCPPTFDVVEFCGKDRCSEDGAPVACLGSCDLKRGKVFSVPIGSFVEDLEGRSLLVSLAYGGCEGGGDAELQATIDGAPGKASRWGSGGHVFEWDPFPDEPNALELFYDGFANLECVSALIFFGDAACERDREPCPL